jgi:hypothetical protein
MGDPFLLTCLEPVAVSSRNGWSDGHGIGGRMAWNKQPGASAYLSPNPILLMPW